MLEGEARLLEEEPAIPGHGDGDPGQVQPSALHRRLDPQRRLPPPLACARARHPRAAAARIGIERMVSERWCACVRARVHVHASMQACVSVRARARVRQRAVLRKATRSDAAREAGRAAASAASTRRAAAEPKPSIPPTEAPAASSAAERCRRAGGWDYRPRWAGRGGG